MDKENNKGQIMVQLDHIGIRCSIKKYGGDETLIQRFEKMGNQVDTAAQAEDYQTALDRIKDVRDFVDKLPPAIKDGIIDDLDSTEQGKIYSCSEKIILEYLK